MPTEVVVERFSEEMEFATVSRWYPQEGDRVNEGEPLVEIEADKVNYDIEAPVGGVLAKILAVSGDEVAVGARLAIIEEG